MYDDARPCGGRLEGGLRRHLHVIGARRIEGAVAADCRADPNCATRVRGKRPSTVNGKFAPLTLILQHIRRYLEPCVRQSDSGATSKVWTPPLQFVVESGNELAVTEVGQNCGINMIIDP